MPYFGVPIRNGLSIGLGSVAALGVTTTAAPPPPPADITVLSSDGTSYGVSFSVLTSAGTPYTITSTVLDSAGNPYTV